VCCQQKVYQNAAAALSKLSMVFFNQASPARTFITLPLGMKK
jgi:hypothetical protein